MTYQRRVNCYRYDTNKMILAFESLEPRALLSTNGFTKVFEELRPAQGFDPLISMNKYDQVAYVSGDSLSHNELYVGSGDVASNPFRHDPSAIIKNTAANDAGFIALVVEEAGVQRLDLIDPDGNSQTQLDLTEGFISFSAVALNNEGTIAFVGTKSNQISGVYRIINGLLTTIVERSVVSGADFGHWIALNDLDAVTFYANGALYSYHAGFTTLIGGEPNLPRVDIFDVGIIDEPTSGIGSAKAVFRVVAAPHALPLTLHFQTTDITATSGADYGGISDGTVTIPVGQVEAYIEIPIFHDGTAEDGIEMFALDLTSIEGDALPYATLGDARAIGRIRDLDHDPLPAVSVWIGSTVFANEPVSGQLEAIFTIYVGGVGHDPASISYQTVDITATAGEDYQEMHGTLNFASPDTVPMQVHVPIFADGIYDGGPIRRDERFALVLRDGATGALINNYLECEISDSAPAIRLSPVLQFSVNNFGSVAFSANQHSGNLRNPVVLVANGDQPTTLVNGTGAFREFGEGEIYSARINDANRVAFWAITSAGERGIFTVHDSLIEKVISTADQLDEAPVRVVQPRFSLNNAGTVSFAVSKYGSTWSWNGLATSIYRTGNSTESSAVTVVVHGFQAANSLGLGSTLTVMAENLYHLWNRSTDAAVYTYRPASGLLTLSYGASSPAHKIIIFDWKTESDAIAPGFDEAAGDALFAMLVQQGLLSSDYLHLIGHSRGAIVVSETAQRLAFYKYRVDQVTLLDFEEGLPPLNAAGKAVAWDGAGLVDNIFGTGTAGMQGEPISGAYNYGPMLVGHTAVREEYQRSILDPSSDVLLPTLYGTRAYPEARLVAQLLALSPKTPVAQPPSVINGNFEYEKSLILGMDAGWDSQGGGGSIDIDPVPARQTNALHLSSDDYDAAHNRLFVSNKLLRFEAAVDLAAAGSTFHLSLRDATGLTTLLSSSASLSTNSQSGWNVYSVDVSQFKRQVVYLDLEINQGTNLTPSVMIDNIWFAGSKWQNGNLFADVDRNNRVEPRDALIIINRLQSGAYDLGNSTPLIGDFLVDTNGDGLVSPIDALRVINHIQNTASTSIASPLLTSEFGVSESATSFLADGTLDPSSSLANEGRHSLVSALHAQKLEMDSSTEIQHTVVGSTAGRALSSDRSAIDPSAVDEIMSMQSSSESRGRYVTLPRKPPSRPSQLTNGLRCGDYFDESD